MLNGMTPEQFQEWRAYADLEPFGGERDDFHAAQVVQALLNVHRGKNKPVIPLRDCVLRFTPQAPASPEQARGEMRAAMKGLMAVQTIGRKRKKKE